MIGPIGTCEKCGTAWDTWIGYSCTNCGEYLSKDVIKKFEDEHRKTFLSMCTRATTNSKQKRKCFFSFLPWVD